MWQWAECVRRNVEVRILEMHHVKTSRVREYLRLNEHNSRYSKKIELKSKILAWSRNETLTWLIFAKQCLERANSSPEIVSSRIFWAWRNVCPSILWMGVLSNIILSPIWFWIPLNEFFCSSVSPGHAVNFMRLKNKNLRRFLNPKNPYRIFFNPLNANFSIVPRFGLFSNSICVNFSIFRNEFFSIVRTDELRIRSCSYPEGSRSGRVTTCCPSHVTCQDCHVISEMFSQKVKKNYTKNLTGAPWTRFETSTTQEAWLLSHQDFVVIIQGVIVWRALEVFSDI